MINRRAFTAGALALAATPLAAYAQQQGRVPRIALLSTVPAGDTLWQTVLEGLRDLGYVDGRTVTIEYFIAPNIAEVPQYAAKAVASRPDVIVTAATPAPVAAKALTSTIPIVLASGGNPVEIGLVASLSRPGGNVTGASTAGALIAGKQLEFLKEIIPGLSRVTSIFQPEDPAAIAARDGAASASRRLGIDIVFVEARTGDEIDQAFAQAATNGAQAVRFGSGVFYGRFADRIAALGLRYRLPVLDSAQAITRAGGLVSYSADLPAVYRRAAYFVDRILKGTKPADLPVEEPTKFELLLNLKTAKALGLDIPFLIEARADEVIE